MSGRHRRTQLPGTKRALAGTVPVLGLAGMVTAVAGTATDTAPEASGTATVDRTTTAATPVGVDQPDLGIGPDITTVAADAARAAGRADEQQREQERQSITAIVDDVQDDARARDAAAAEQGRQQVDTFRQAQEQREKDEQKSESPAPRDDEQSCTLAGLPLMGGSADPDEIVGRDCGLVDLLGKQRSSDPWLDGQLLSAQGDD